MLNAKKRFIDEMKLETESYMYNISCLIPEFPKECADALMSLYNETAENAVAHMTLIACEKNPDAFCLYVISSGCSALLLDPSKDGLTINGRSLSRAGKALMDLYQLTLKQIAADPKTPAGMHNTTRLEFVKKQLAARMEK